MKVATAKDLKVYQLAYEVAQEILRATKTFPPEEKFGLTSQIRRSSRSVPMNLREAWAKRRYEAHFVSKLTDCDGESAETDTALDFALDAGYLSEEEHAILVDKNRQVGKMLGAMINNPESFLVKDSLRSKKSN